LSNGYYAAAYEVLIIIHHHHHIIIIRQSLRASYLHVTMMMIISHDSASHYIVDNESYQE